MAQITLNSSGVASSGALVLQSNGTTTAVTVSTGQVATFANDAVVNGLTVGRGLAAVATNTAVGASALAANTSGASNSGFGYQALKSVTTNSDNSAFGTNSMRDTSTGAANSAFGSAALIQNTTGSYNTAIGQTALFSNTTASNCTAVGYQAAYSNTTGEITAIGRKAGYTNTTANACVYVGDSAGFVATGSSNTFIGYDSGNAMTTGAKNSIIGRYNGNQGGLDIRTSSNYIVLSDGDGNPRGVFDNTGRLLVGTTSVVNAETGLGVANSTSGNAVTAFRNSRNTSGDVCSQLFVGSNCQNTSSYLLQGGVFGVANVFYVFGNGNVQNTNNSYGAISDVKLKENIVDATPKLADLMQVKVRSYNLIGSATKQIGVIAQELETIFPAMVDESPDRDSENNVLETKTKSVKYSVFVPMLIKAIQELKAEFDAYKATHP